MIEAAVLAAVLATGPNTIPDSSYTGRWYVAEAEPFRKCVMWRESRGNYRSNGRYGSGAYQFIQPTWEHYATLAGFEDYADERAYKAPPAVQDAVFWRTYWKGKGKHHWSAIHALTIGARVKDCA